MKPLWRNWSGSAHCTPRRLLTPRGEAEVVDAVNLAARDGLGVRAAGTGHSFNPLACTDGILLDLSRFAGVTEIDRQAGTVTVKPGTTLRQVNAALDREGMALPNIGSLVDQTVAGAMSTGNHGSGMAHGPLSSTLKSMRMVTADGTASRYDSTGDPDVWRCARTALGTLGVFTELTLACVPKFNLLVKGAEVGFDEFLEQTSDWPHSADHVQLNWSPWQDAISLRSLHRTDAPISTGSRFKPYRTTVDELRCGIIGLAGRFHPPSVRALSDRDSGPAGPDRPWVSSSADAFAFAQPIKFLALEHALPLAELAPALTELRGVLRRAGTYSPYSVLARVGAGDDAPLSPAYGRDTAYLNVTVPRPTAYHGILRVVEQVLRDFGARPHWGKAHTATAEVLSPRYPEWQLFQDIRAKLDPDGRFGNDYVNGLLGPVHGTGRAGQWHSKRFSSTSTG